MKPIAAPIVGGMITSTIHVLILVPVFFVLMKSRSLRHGTLKSSQQMNASVITPKPASHDHFKTGQAWQLRTPWF
jgi:hypothetical protein